MSKGKKVMARKKTRRIRRDSKGAKTSSSKLNFALLSAFFSDDVIELEKDKEVTFHVKNGLRQLILFKTADPAKSVIFGNFTRDLRHAHRLPI